MRDALILTMLVMAAAGPVRAADIRQNDWSGGGGDGGPVTAFGDRFAEAVDASWRAVPGRLALSGTPRTPVLATTVASGFDGAFGVAAADFDGDGDVDIVGAAEYARSLVLWTNDGAAAPAFSPLVLDADYQDVAAVEPVDLEGDGDIDIVASSGNRYGRVTAYRNGGGSPATWTAEIIDPSWGEAWEIATGDVDGDGRIDVIGTSLTGGDVVWWHNGGGAPASWTRRAVDESFSVAHCARAGDIDGDGDTDVVACGTTTSTVAWWRNDGGDPISWTKSVIATNLSGARSVRLSDLDGDGDLDVAGAGFGNRVMWWSNEGGVPVTWAAQTIETGLSKCHQLQVADLNGDGLEDLVVAAYGSNAVVWYENGGGALPIAWTRHIADATLTRPLAANVGDVDGDGALEIIGASNTGDLVRWYDVTSFVPQGSLTSSVIDAGAPPIDIAWTADAPAGTGLRCEVRSGDDPADLGPWSAPVTAPGALADLEGRYFQYRLLLDSSDPAVSPVVDTISFQPAVAAVPTGRTRPTLAVHPNPANPRALVVVDLPRGGRTRAEIFDLRGRRLQTLVDGVLPAGRHTLPWNGTDTHGRAVATGIYQVLLQAEGAVRGTRLTLLR